MSKFWSSYSKPQEASTSQKAPRVNGSLYELHKPLGTPQMQVLFFHGLQFENLSSDIHLNTWECADGSYWPQTWLGERFPRAHILCVSYDGGLKQDSSRVPLDMYLVGENITSDLLQEGIGQMQDCPVILVGHSFGGLVIKQLCMQAHDELCERKRGFRNEKLRTFLKNIKGIFYYATPHHGSNLVEKISKTDANPLLKYFGSLSADAERLNGRFDNIRAQYGNWHIFGLGEGLKTKLGRFTEDVLVPEASSRVEDFYTVRDANHFTICKPEKKVSARFSKLESFLDKIARDVEVEANKRKDAISFHLDEVAKRDESYYMVPSWQVSDYIERTDLLESVKTAIQQMREQQRRQVVVLLGMGGQGKSQLALEYCRKVRLSKEFRAIFWIDATSIESVHRSFESIASKIADPSRIFANSKEKVAFVKDTMEGWDSCWLLVFDNYDAPSTDFHLAEFFPSSASGTILVTSRHEDSKRLGKVIPLERMTEQESLNLLFCRSENEHTDENTETGKLIVARLGFLPVAIDQAGAFINSQKLPLTLFFDRFELQKEEILKYTPSLTEYKRVLGDDEKKTALNVFTTWELSFQQIHKGETGERLRSFLTTAAFFNTRDIGEDLFHRANDLETVPLWRDAFISEGEWDRDRYRKALAELSGLSLLIIPKLSNNKLEDMKHCRFYLHPLIADWLRLRVGLEGRRHCTIETCYLLAKLIVSLDIESCSYAFCLYLMEQVDECLNNKGMYLNPIDEDAGFTKIVTLEFVKLLEKTSRYREGISLLEEALPILETAYGKDHASTLDTVHKLGVVYFKQGKLAEAEEMWKRGLAGRERTLGKDHASTLASGNSLGVLYMMQGKLAEAEEMCKCALVGYERTLGKDHASTFYTVNNVGLLYEKQEKFAEAEEMYNRALAGYERAFGKDHASTFNTVYNLGLLYGKQEKFSEAEEMYNRALAGYERTLGKDHASTLDTVYNLGVLYKKQEKFSEAEEMYNRALAGYERAFGKDHASTLDTVYNLGLLYGKQEKFSEAEEMYNRVLAGRERTLGKDHASTFDTVNKLGLLYGKQEKFAEAEEMYNRALAGYERTLGKDHASTLDTVYNLGVLYKKQEKFSEAEEMYNRALAGYERTLGKDHASTFDTVYNLGLLYGKQEKFSEAEEMYNRALAGYERTLGKDHASTLDTVYNLGVLYKEQEKFSEAEEMYNRALAGYERTLGKDHASTFNTVYNLGLLYGKQEKFSEAEEMYNRALAGYERTLGKDHASTLDTVYNLGVMYKEQEKFSEAEEMYNRALAGYERAFGKDHAWTFDTVYNLGLLYGKQEKFSEAEEMYNRVLAGRERTLGKDHASTFDTVNKLGLLYIKQGKFAEAEEMFNRALAGYERALGIDHKFTLYAVFNKALLMGKQEDFAGATQLFERAFFGYSILLGADNYCTVSARQQLERMKHLQSKKVNSKRAFLKSLLQRLK